MKELSMQPRIISGVLCLVPMNLDDEEKLKAYRINQPLVTSIKGSKKERSLKQLGTYWGCCNVVAENHHQFNSRNDVDDKLRVELEFFDKNRCLVGKDGQVHVFYRSIAVANLEHIEANKYFDRAFSLMADWLGITPALLIANCTRGQI